MKKDIEKKKRDLKNLKMKIDVKKRKKKDIEKKKKD